MRKQNSHTLNFRAISEQISGKTREITTGFCFCAKIQSLRNLLSHPVLKNLLATVEKWDKIRVLRCHLALNLCNQMEILGISVVNTHTILGHEIGDL